MRHSSLLIPFLLSISSIGCVASSTIKDASTKHTSNLVGIQQAVGEYRKKLNAYYDRLLQAQREAHIAMNLNKSIDAMAEKQAANIASELVKTPNSQAPAKDFIRAGAEITETYTLWGTNFDQWVELVEKTGTKDVLKAFQEAQNFWEREAAKFEQAGNREAAAKFRAEAHKNDDELTFVSNAIKLKQQRERFDTELALLAAQITTMQAFHSKINEFLAADATIDGSKIAEAAAAGSKADVAGILKRK